MIHLQIVVHTKMLNIGELQKYIKFVRRPVLKLEYRDKVRVFVNIGARITSFETEKIIMKH